MVEGIIAVSMIQIMECEIKRIAKVYSIKEKAREVKLRYLVQSVAIISRRFLAARVDLVFSFGQYDVILTRKDLK